MRNNVVDGLLAPEFSRGFGVEVAIFAVAASVVGVPEGFVELGAIEEETEETTGSGVTSSVEEFCAFAYEAPPPRT